MEVNLTDEQVDTLVKETIERYVMGECKKRIDKVLNSEYRSYQDIEEGMRKATASIMLNKINEALSDKELSKFLDTEEIAESVTERVLDVTTDKMREAFMDMFQ